MRTTFALLLCLICASPALVAKKPPKTYSIPLPPATDYSALDWLMGDWSGKTAEKSPDGQVRLSVAYDLDRRFVVLREKITLAATETTPAVNESWMGILSGGNAPNEFSLRVFSTTGFMTRYRVTVDKAEVRFTPEGGEQPPPGWLFRRGLSRLGPGEVSETVEAAPPDGTFFPYYSATLAREGAATQQSAADGDTAPK